MDTIFSLRSSYAVDTRRPDYQELKSRVHQGLLERLDLDRLADGSRVNAIIPPVALDGPTLSIRRFRTEKMGSQDLVERDALTQPMLDFLQAAVASRLNVIVSGGTGAGKTTLLNVLSGFIS